MNGRAFSMAFSPKHAKYFHYLVIIIDFVGRYDLQYQSINVSVIQFHILMKVIMTKIGIISHFLIQWCMHIAFRFVHRLHQREDSSDVERMTS